MSSIDDGKWKERKREVYLNPKLLEEPILGEHKHHEGFDDLRKHKKSDEDKLNRILNLFVIGVIFLFAFTTMLLYWLRWS